MAQRGRKSPNALPTDRPSPTLVFTAPEPLPPPPNLSAETKKWWTEVTTKFVMETHEYKLLEAACRAWDLLMEAEDVITKEGLTMPGRNGPKARPEIAIARDARIAFARLIRDLRLGLDEPKGGHSVAYDRFGNPV